MVYDVVLTDKAIADVDSVLKWFHDQGATDAGRRWYKTLLDKLKTLENDPTRLAITSESHHLGIEIRELLVGRPRYRYRVFFQIHEDTVMILRVWHGSRDQILPDDMI